MIRPCSVVRCVESVVLMISTLVEFSHVLVAYDSLKLVSAWNDNGFRERIEDPSGFHRSEFFPGLGWMMTRQFWEELHPKWPDAFWDDWLRDNENRRNR